jgi:penicillin-insensitive murein endopeptidase
MRLYVEEDKGWGTSELLQTIVLASAHMERRYPGHGRLQVEDLSARSGGKIEGHNSHQNGLDADLTYYRLDGEEHDPIATGQKYSPSMVVNGRISLNFDTQRNWEFMKALHRSGPVQRIFVDRVIKAELCRHAKLTGEYAANVAVLRSLRHEENHADHMHVRLRCPLPIRRCAPQADLTGGSGCP